MAVENVEEPISLEEATPQIGKVLSLVLTSVEKDLKIKLIDEDETLVKGVPWSVTVSDSEGKNVRWVAQLEKGQELYLTMTDGKALVTVNETIQENEEK